MDRSRKLALLAVALGGLTLSLAGCGGGDNSSAGGGGIAPPPPGYQAVPNGPPTYNNTQSHSAPGSGGNTNAPARGAR